MKKMKGAPGLESSRFPGLRRWWDPVGHANALVHPEHQLGGVGSTPRASHPEQERQHKEKGIIIIFNQCLELIN